MLIRKFRDEGDSAGAADQGGAGGAGTQDGGAGEGGTVDYKAFYDSYQTDFAPKLKELGVENHSELVTKYGDLKTTVGKQGNDLKGLKDLRKAMSESPRDFIKQIAKDDPELKAVLKFTDEEPVEFKMMDIVADDNLTPEEKDAKINEFLKSRDEKVAQKVVKQFDPIREKIEEQELSAKYPDWKDHSEARTALAERVKANGVPAKELLHLAVLAEKLPDVIKDAKAKGKEEALAEITRKMGEGMTIPQIFKLEKVEGEDKTKNLKGIVGILKEAR